MRGAESARGERMAATGDRVERSAIEKPTATGDLVVGIATLAIVGLSAAIVFPLGIFVPTRVAWTANSPGFFPHLLLLAAGVLGLLLLVQSLRARNLEAPSPRAPLRIWTRAGVTAAIIAAYIASIMIVGLLVASILALAVALYHFGERRPFLLTSTAVAVPLLLWMFFVHVANVPMPRPLLAHWLAAIG